MNNFFISSPTFIFPLQLCQVHKVIVNNQPERSIEISGKEISVNGKIVDWDLAVVGKNRFHIISNHRSYNCEVLSADRQKKNFGIKVNGKILHVTVKDRFDELLRELGMDKVSHLNINIIKAPMPGLVLKILVSEGTEIKQGDSLLILEAMKMENVIKSPGEGKVKNVKVKERQAVEKGQELIELQ